MQQRKSYASAATNSYLTKVVERTTLKKHAHKTSLQNLLNLSKINTTLPSIMQPNSSTKSCPVTNGAPQDRLAHAEVIAVSFLAENSLTFTFAPKLLRLAQ